MDAPTAIPDYCIQPRAGKDIAECCAIGQSTPSPRPGVSCLGRSAARNDQSLDRMSPFLPTPMDQPEPSCGQTLESTADTASRASSLPRCWELRLYSRRRQRTTTDSWQVPACSRVDGQRQQKDVRGRGLGSGDTDPTRGLCCCRGCSRGAARRRKIACRALARESGCRNRRNASHL